MKNITPHDKRVRLHPETPVFREGSLIQVNYRPVDPSFGRKAWITHFKGSKGWSVAGCALDKLAAELSHDGPLKRAHAVAMASAYIIHGHW